MKKGKAIFLDRDGVINKKPEEHDYVKSVEELIVLPDSQKAISFIKESGYLVIVVTNQRGIARKILSKKTLDEIHKSLKSIDAFYVCPHNLQDNCGCRKPQPGLIKEAAEEFNLDLKSSFLIGDSEADRMAAYSAGIPEKNILIMATNDSLLKAVKTLNL